MSCHAQHILLKGIVHPKMKIQSTFTNAGVVLISLNQVRRHIYFNVDANKAVRDSLYNGMHCCIKVHSHVLFTTHSFCLLIERQCTFKKKCQTGLDWMVKMCITYQKIIRPRVFFWFFLRQTIFDDGIMWSDESFTIRPGTCIKKVHLKHCLPWSQLMLLIIHFNTLNTLKKMSRCYISSD